MQSVIVPVAKVGHKNTPWSNSGAVWNQMHPFPFGATFTRNMCLCAVLLSALNRKSSNFICVHYCYA